MASYSYIECTNVIDVYSYVVQLVHDDSIHGGLQKRVNWEMSYCGLGYTTIMHACNQISWPWHDLTIYSTGRQYPSREHLNEFADLVMVLLVTAILVLAVQHTGAQQLGELVNVTVEQGVTETIKYTVDTRNHTVQVNI